MKNEMDEQFDVFWKSYPRRVGKLKAKKAFNKIKPDRALFKKMLESIEKSKGNEQWDSKKYIPHAATWLNGERWEDEIEVDKDGVSAWADEEGING
jgi:hypothetical protein